MFKKGDKVYSILRGWGEIEKIYPSNQIGVRFTDRNFEIYNPDGKYSQLDINPELYHTEPVITVPKRRVEHTGWIQIADNGHLGWRWTSAYIYDDKGEFDKVYSDKDGFTKQQITYYTEEN